MQETYWQKRLAEPKGWVEYNPNETFVIHVQWVVANRVVAGEMLAALRRCAAATLRDAPPVVSYFFRISHDQRLAESMKQAVATIGDHPLYKKKYKLAAMNMPLPLITAGCERDGLSAAPFHEGWPSDTAMTAERAAQVGFDPVVLDCTEVYLDNRAFFNHSASMDYQDAYAVLMQPYRSLASHVVVAGSYSTGVWDRVLEPSLKARRAEGDERLVLCEPDWRHVSATSKYVLLDLDFDDAEAANQFVAAVDAPYKCVFASAEASSYRVLMPVLLPSGSARDFPDVSKAAGRAVVFGSGDDEDECAGLRVGGRIEVVAATAGAAAFVAGYGLCERASELTPDPSVEYQGEDKL